MESANDLKKLLHKGLLGVRVLQANCFTYYINNGQDGEWINEELQILEQFFFNIKICEEADLVKSGAVEIECRGLPLIAWMEEYLKVFTKDLGEWITWSFQNQHKLELYDPCITCVTKQTKSIY